MSNDRKAESVDIGLANGRLLFFVHQPHQYKWKLPSLIGDLSARFQQIGIGVVARLCASSTREFVQECRKNTGIVLVDPEAYDPQAPRQVRDGYPYGQPPRDDPEAWINEVLEAELELGATVLLTPSVFIDTTPTSVDFFEDVEMRRIRYALRRRPEPVAVNLTLDYPWLSDQRYRERLLANLLDLNADLFYIRVYWPMLYPRYGQLSDKTILEGYKELVWTLAGEGRSLILPTTSLTGWLAMAWGASGFSTGPSRSQQAYAREPRIVHERGERYTKIRRYYEPSLMHIIELTAHDVLLGYEHYKACDCPYCVELQATVPGMSTAI